MPNSTTNRPHETSKSPILLAETQAAAMGVSEGTVKIHVSALFKALDVRSRMQAVLAAA